MSDVEESQILPHGTPMAMCKADCTREYDDHTDPSSSQSPPAPRKKNSLRKSVATAAFSPVPKPTSKSAKAREITPVDTEDDEVVPDSQPLTPTGPNASNCHTGATQFVNAPHNVFMARIKELADKPKKKTSIEDKIDSLEKSLRLPLRPRSLEYPVSLARPRFTPGHHGLPNPTKTALPPLKKRARETLVAESEDEEVVEKGREAQEALLAEAKMLRRRKARITQLQGEVGRYATRVGDIMEDCRHIMDGLEGIMDALDELE